MKKKLFYLLLTALVINFTSCKDDKDAIDPLTEKENALSSILPQYVNNTIIVTYKNLADATIELEEALAALKANTNDANVRAATQAWIKSRTYWELSEAFLYGAVADFGIDPHIDTWPLDEEAFSKLMNNQGFLESMDAEDGAVWAADHLGYALLGYHGIEFVLYKEGNPKSASEITQNELIYAVAVGGDLRNQCLRLEAAWAGYDNVTAFKQNIIDELELAITPSNSDDSYGDNMLNAGQAGSTYRTITRAVVAILDGCTTISDEVGELKIGSSYRGDDINYIESPYSYNSLIDFEDNIKSIANAYLGGADENNRGTSVSDYVKSINAGVDTEVKNAINATIEKIRAIPHPFDENYTSPQAGEAISACEALTTALNRAKDVVNQ
jgi:hypothetical protein